MAILTVEEWEQKYHPIVNHLDPNASWQNDEGTAGIMFETYGEEEEFVMSHRAQRRVWSYRDDEFDGTIIVGGVSHSAIGYFVTEKPWSLDDVEDYVQVTREVV